MTGFLAFVAWALQAASSLPPEAQDPDRPKVSIRDFKGLRENNIFAPARPKRTEPPKSEPRRTAPSAPPPAPPAKPRTPVVTGIVFDEGTQAYQALVEDRNADVKLKLFAQPRFLKAGEEFLGYTIESVGAEVVSVKVGETVKELRVGESFPERVGAAAEKKEESAAPSEGNAETAAPGGKTEGAPSGGKTEATPPAGKAEAAPALEDAERNKVLEELKKKFKKKREESDFQEP